MSGRICIHNTEDDVLGPIAGWAVRIGRADDYIGPFPTAEAAAAWFGEWYPPEPEPEEWVDEPTPPLHACIIPVHKPRPVQGMIIRSQAEQEKDE